jgi:hypothetical protein
MIDSALGEFTLPLPISTLIRSSPLLQGRRHHEGRWRIEQRMAVTRRLLEAGTSGIGEHVFLTPYGGEYGLAVS